jgi:hypothetical protein
MPDAALMQSKRIGWARSNVSGVTMQEQMIDGRISMEHMADSLAVAAEDEKMTARDLLAFVEQIAACLVFCGFAHLVF